MKYDLDLEKIAKELDFDLEDVEMLLEVSLEGMNSALEEMKIALKTNNKEKLSNLAHSIKGSALNLTLNDIANFAREIELNAKNSTAEYDYQKAYESLKKLVNSIKRDV